MRIGVPSRPVTEVPRAGACICRARAGRPTGSPIREHGCGGLLPDPYGPGWALVGDAGYDKDPITGMGISDAFRYAELCASRLDAWLRGSTPFHTAMADYQHIRDAQLLPMFELTCTLARLEPPPPHLQQLLASAHGNQKAMDAFVSMMAGTLPVADFFANPPGRREDGLEAVRGQR
jgi:hypothetical protein